MNLEEDVLRISGIGRERKEKLLRLGIDTIDDLITYFPRDYEDRSKTNKIGSVILNEKNIISGYIKTPVENIRRKGITLTKTKISDETGTIDVTWFNQPYLKNILSIGKHITLVGKVTNKYGSIAIQSPQIIQDKELEDFGGIVPIYSLTYKITQKLLRKSIKSSLDEIGEVRDYIPESIRNRYRLCDYNFALNNIHFPKSTKDFYAARDRLVFEELFFMELGMFALKRKINDKRCYGISFEKRQEINDFINSLSFELTNSQTEVIAEILDDMKKFKSMNRLLQGDVGSGKTLVAMVALLNCVLNGYQGAFMVPTEVLAKQHYKELKKHFKSMNIALLVGSLTKKEKENVYKEIEEGKVDIVIGTHAIIEDGVKFKNLGLIITDEQHRFGVRQREKFTSKSKMADVLVMTATPIPRTLALILYGDLDISTMRDMPKGRKIIDTHIVNKTHYERMYEFIRKEVSEGRQIYFVCPNVEESEENEELKSVIEYSEELKSVFSEFNVEYLHGKIKTKEKNRIMEEFLDNKINILVSTTVIEVGVNVPNATIMIIENAERFGLAQLHQLRGRVGRGEHKSYCMLVTECKTEVCSQRMDIMKNSNDGFVIAEKDLEIRGPGEFFGTKQHGIPEFKIANLYKDINILKLAQKEAENYLGENPELSIEIIEKLDKMFSSKILL
ncbi:MAG: ATP-dependent DNA helicase RecG [Clostridia bacterium]|jgi:ATP-dependent DNA helicase RecG|nr:ATP-dependent DNA helicase RecG [Clostridia bacterium]